MTLTRVRPIPHPTRLTADNDEMSTRPVYRPMGSPLAGFVAVLITALGLLGFALLILLPLLRFA